MKKHLFPLLALLLTASACTRTVRPLFGLVEVDTLLGASGNRIEVAYEFVTIANADRSPALREIERANLDYFFGPESGAATPQEAVDASLAEIAADYLPHDREAFPFIADYTISARAEAETTDSLLTYTIYRESYTGGAHGMYSTEYHTYSLDSGEELTVADLFDEQTLSLLRGQLREKLAEKYAAGTPGESTDAVLEANGFFPAEIDLTDNFRIDPDGSITFFYNPYDIACYATGAVEATFTQDELRALR